ncbi:hypothetical protein F5Y09DRAFT_321793 [Xylaria sp. FL1042]|nr:hypothetical protein F5Y09DRAFT_321793 [Xylaria sp. FL1042]
MDRGDGTRSSIRAALSLSLSACACDCACALRVCLPVARLDLTGLSIQAPSQNGGHRTGSTGGGSGGDIGGVIVGGGAVVDLVMARASSPNPHGMASPLPGD